jgi:hypothetical protein
MEIRAIASVSVTGNRCSSGAARISRKEPNPIFSGSANNWNSHAGVQFGPITRHFGARGKNCSSPWSESPRNNSHNFSIPSVRCLSLKQALKLRKRGFDHEFSICFRILSTHH